MKNLFISNAAVLFFLISCSNEPSEISYPTSKKIDFIETIHGYEIEDQYRWLEDFTSEESQEWVVRQNDFTQKFISKNTSTLEVFFFSKKSGIIFKEVRHLRIIITGFKPFMSHDVNPTEEIISILPGQIYGNEIIRLLLPVEFDNSFDVLKEAIEFGKFDNMKKLEQSKSVTKDSLAYKGDARAMKVRSGKVDGYKEHLSDKDIKKINKVLGQ